MTQVPQPLPPARLLAFGLVNLPLSMLMSPTAAVLPNFYLEYSAVTLAGSSLAVGNAADRLAIVGERAGSGGAIDDDYFRLQLSEGQAASFALAWADGGSGELRLQLLAPDGTALDRKSGV